MHTKQHDYTFRMLKLLLSTCLLCAFPMMLLGQIQLVVVAPLDYQVFQRQNASNGTILIEASIETPTWKALTNCDRLEARLITKSGQKETTDNRQPLLFDK